MTAQQSQPSRPPQTQSPPQTAPAPLTPEQQRNRELLDKMLDHPVEFTPFLAKSSIELTARKVLRFLCKPTKSGKLCSPEQAVRFVKLCEARGLNPWEGDAYIVGYDTNSGPEFNLITAHQAFLKRAEVHPEYDGMESGVLVIVGGDYTELQGDFVPKGAEIAGGWARVHFKTRTVPMYKRLALATFNKGFSRWNLDAPGMIVKCAEADALRSAFPNSLAGMYLRDEFDGEAQAEPAKTAPLALGRTDLRALRELPRPTNGTAEPIAAAPPETVAYAPVDAAGEERGDAFEGGPEP